MDLDFEQRVIQNVALGATVLWQFSRSFYDAVDQAEGPDLPRVMLVLPMVFHRQTIAAVGSMHLQSGLLKALADEPAIVLGLQRRLQGFTAKTFASLAVACAAGLIVPDRSNSWPKYVPVGKNLPGRLRPENADMKRMISSSKRLGHWFAKSDLATICSYLEVRF